MQGAQCRFREQIGDRSGQHRQHGDEARQRQKTDPFLEQVGRQVGQEHEIADPLAVDDQWGRRVHVRDDEQVDEPLLHAMRLARTGRWRGLGTRFDRTELDIGGGAQRMDKGVERLPRIVRGAQGVVERRGDRSGRMSPQFVLVGQLAGRKALEQHAAHDQRGEEAHAERKKQLGSERQVLPH
ncbi:hypothetical protein ACVIWV_008406 [Bradyrhizobium diazoefficiens]